MIANLNLIINGANGKECHRISLVENHREIYKRHGSIPELIKRIVEKLTAMRGSYDVNIAASGNEEDIQNLHEKLTKNNFSDVLLSSRPCLTARELEVLDWLNKGLNEKLAGEKMGISYGTVRNHSSNICEKFECDSIHAVIVIG